MKKIALTLLCIFAFSCTSNTIFKKPDDLIEKEKMIDLLTDLYLATAAKTAKNLQKERNVDYTQLVFEKHGIDSARFKRSNFYYTAKIDVYEAIFKEVKSRIASKNDTFKSLKKKRDSLKNDSIRKVIIKRDSLRKTRASKTK
jgi:arsenate reductase-like glutaredoxin family protein